MRAEAVYRVLLRCYPAAFRDEYGTEMSLIFGDQLDEARRTGGWLRVAILWLEAARDALIIAPKEHSHVMFQDLRYAFRVMAANPGFAVVAILSLALGIGANTAIFSLWNNVIHASLPGVYKPEQLVMLSDPDAGGGMWHGFLDGERKWLTYGEFEQLRDSADSFSGIIASQSSLATWHIRSASGDWVELRGRLVSGAYFNVLGVRPILGRVFTPADDHTDSPYAVISYDCWKRRFSGRINVLGTTVTLWKAALTIIGVAPPGFIGETTGQQPDLWLPLRMQPSVIPGDDRLHDTPPEKVMWLNVFARLKPGISPQQAEAQANTIFRGGLESFYGALSPESLRAHLDQHLRIHAAKGGASDTRTEFSSPLTALLAGVAVLLLIACANIANLLLARGAARKPEIALRLSLGASRGRLIRQLFTESLALAIVGGVLGLVAAWLFHSALARLMAQSERDFQIEFALDPQLLLFTLAVTLFAALLFGLAPALQATRTGPAESLKERSRSATGSLGQMRWGRLLVSLQLALSLPLLVAAALLGRTLYNLEHVNLGFRAANLVMARVDTDAAGYDATRRERFYGELKEQVQNMPGVVRVSYSRLGLFSGGDNSSRIEVEGYTPKGRTDRGSSMDFIGPGYFSTLGMPLIQGREILETDNATALKVCVINQAFAKQFFNWRNPIGMRVTVISENSRTSYQIVGISRDAHTQSIRGNVEPRLYVPAMQQAEINGRVLLVRGGGNPGSVLTAIRQTIRRLDPALPILAARSIDEQMAPSMAQDRMTAQLAAVFGSAALTLSAIGLFGVLSYGAAQRRREIAVRIALGAQPSEIIALIICETVVVIVVGLAIGAVLAHGASRLITSQLYGVAAQDPATLSMAIGLLILVALLSAWLPAQRAALLDPMTVLRCE